MNSLQKEILTELIGLAIAFPLVAILLAVFSIASIGVFISSVLNIYIIGFSLVFVVLLTWYAISHAKTIYLNTTVFAVAFGFFTWLIQMHSTLQTFWLVNALLSLVYLPQLVADMFIFWIWLTFFKLIIKILTK